MIAVCNRTESPSTDSALVTALFVRHDSIYKSIPNVDAWDEKRDARNWPGGTPIVAHPPCAQWGTLKHMARVNPQEKALAPLSVEWIRKYGGVLEHPVRSVLWPNMGLPEPGAGKDEFLGWTLVVSQRWWGHKAEKQTRLYIVGCEPRDIPPISYAIGRAHFICGGGAAANAREAKRRRRYGPEWWRPSISHAEREHTPPAFAEWLVELARKCHV